MKLLKIGLYLLAMVFKFILTIFLWIFSWPYENILKPMFEFSHEQWKKITKIWNKLNEDADKFFERFK